MTASSTSTPPRRTVVGGRTQRRKRLRLVLVALGVVIVVVLAGIVFTVLHQTAHYNANISRIDAFSGLTNRPAAGPKGSQNILIIGSDSRDGTVPGSSDPLKIAETGGQRSDTLILMHLTADHQHAYLISIPRDSYVNIPAAGPWQGGKNKINAAFAYGGARLSVQTVEGLTGDRIDHVVMINFTGFAKMTDALGGVDINVPINSYDHYRNKHWTKGEQHMNGATALLYVRQRAGLPGGDFDRIKHQQQFLAALMDKATSTGTLTNPVKLNRFLDASTKSILVDKQMSVTDEVLALRSLRQSSLTYVTTPYLPQTQREPYAGISVILDKQPAAELFQAVAGDSVGPWLKSHPQYISGGSKPA